MFIDNDDVASIVVDLGYGDSGKGTMTNALCAHAEGSIVIRFNGGGQAAWEKNFSSK